MLRAQSLRAWRLCLSIFSLAAARRASAHTAAGPGGLLRDSSSGPKKVTWTADNDRKILLIGLGKEISMNEYAKIASLFDKTPTLKAVHERLAKLKREQLKMLERLGIIPPRTVIHEAPEEPEESAGDPSGAPVTAEAAEVGTAGV